MSSALRKAAGISASILGLAAVVGGLEGGIRLWRLRYRTVRMPRSSDPRLYAYDPTKGWFHVPNSTGRSFLGGPDAGWVRINSLGLRGGDVPSRKESGVRRVLVFGDSFVFGVGVDEEHLFTSRLQGLLSQASAGERYEVVNMGVSGYSTDQEYILFQELGESLAPDLVLLVMCDNDFSGNVEDFSYQRYYKPYFELGPGGALSLQNSPAPRLDRFRRVKLWLGENSALWNFLRERQSDEPRIQWLLNLFQVKVSRSASTEEQVRVSLALVRAFAESADRRGARFLVTNTGHTGESVELFDALRPELTKAGVPWVALEKPLSRGRHAEPNRLWEFPKNVHWNRDAHDAAARAICEHLRRALPERPARPRK